jgi:hypothetical protein
MRNAGQTGFLIAVFCWIMAGAPPVQANEGRILTYDVYAGGIHALDAHLTIEKSAKTYAVELTSATHGFLGTLAPWSGTFESAGWFLPGGVVRPKEHVSESVWRGEAERKTYHYDSAGKFLSYKVVEGGKDKTPKIVEKKLTEGTTDLLSATLGVMKSLAAGQSCKGKSKIFDGDRNFDLVFHPDGEEVLKKSEYNIYEGSAQICTVEVIPKDGKWRKKPRGWLSIQEQGRKKGALPTIWMAPVAQEKPGEIFVPVKIRVKTDYGTLFMHLTSIENLEKIAKNGQ